MRIKHGISLLLILSAASAAAEPAAYGRDARAEVRIIMLQSAAIERAEVREGSQAMSQERRRNAEVVFPGSGNAFSAQGVEVVPPSAENSRRPGRLSPEERRTLRRQINEVGHDIYAPRR
jgi:hypothetical protein